MEARRILRPTLDPDSRREAVQAIAELVGINVSVSDINFAIDALLPYVKNIHFVGRMATPTGVRNEFVIPLTSRRDRKVLEEVLALLKIFPWEENGLLIIEQPKDIRKLKLIASIKASKNERSVKDEISLEERTDAPTIQNEFPFPLQSPKGKKVQLFPPQTKKNKSPKKKEEKTEGDVLEVDVELADLIARFERGEVDYDDKEFVKRVGLIPNLALFKQKYFWDQGVLYKEDKKTIITKQEQDELLLQARAGNQKALNELVRIHSGLVLSRIALMRDKKRYLNINADDLFQEGLMGLVHAINNQDPEKGSFSTYAVICIEGYMLRFAQQYQYIIRLPVYSQTKRGKYFSATKTGNSSMRDRKEIRKALLKSGVLNSDSDVALNAFEKKYLLRALFDSDESLSEIVGSDAESIDIETNLINLKKRINKVLVTLTPREERVIRLRFGFLSGETIKALRAPLTPPEFADPYREYFTLEEVAEMFCVTRERIRQIEAKAIRRLRQKSRAKFLKPFLDNES